MASDPQSKRVLISGGGIAGLTLGILLKERGYEPIIVEREESLRTEGYMMDFFGTGWDVAERVGLIEELKKIRYPIDRMEFVDREGKPYIDMPIEWMRDALDHRYLYLRRSDLERVIYERAHALGVTIRFATSVVEFAQSETDLTAKFSNGVTETFALAFGADGVHSHLRALAFGDEDAFSDYLGGYVAAIHMEDARLDLDRALKMHEETKYIAAFYPLGNGAADATFVFRHPEAGHIPAEERLPLLQQKTAGPGWMSGRVLAALPSSVSVYFDSLTQIRMPQWHRGRVALLGDACGCLTLLAGQGSHMAMADAYVLATELQRHGDDHVAAFRAYEAQMKPPTVRKQTEAKRFAEIVMPSETSRFWLRRIATRLMFSRLGLTIGMRIFGSKSVLEGYPA